MNWLSIRQKLTYDEVQMIIKKLKIVLPQDYCEKIGEINGGALTDATCIVPNLGEVAYSRNLSLLENVNGNAIAIFKIMQEKQKNLFPFGSVGNGDYFCFDLLKQDVVLYMHEKDITIYVCKSYTELLSLLS
ncbi:MAG: SMI1/KNR4 family protein [Eubacteriales bacterium]|nr:SMI1/KNR4 family protein [Eubacteriales bacterium]